MKLDGNNPLEEKKTPWYKDGKYNVVIRLTPEDYAELKLFVKDNGCQQAKVLRTAIREFLDSRGYRKGISLKDEFMRLYEEEMK